MKDPYSFPSDTSWSFEDDANTDSSWTSLGSDTDSDDDIQFVDSVFFTTKTEGNSWLILDDDETSSDSATPEFSSPEIMRFQDRDDNNQFRRSVFNSDEIEEIKFGNPTFTSTRNEGNDDKDVVCLESTINRTKKIKFGNPTFTSTRNEGNDDKDVVCLESTINRTKKYDFGNPKLTSTRNEGSDNDVTFLESVIPAAKTRGSFKEKGDFIDSRCVDAENSSSQLPEGIDYVNNFVKTPPFQDFDYEVKDEDMEVHEESLIPISLKTFVNEEDKGHISKFSEGKKSPENEWPSFHRYFENVEDLQHTTVNSSEIVDDVIKTSNDTSNSKMNVTVLQILSTEESQEEKWSEYKRKPFESLTIRPLSKNELFSDTKRGKNKRRRYVKPKNASVAENQGSNSNQKKRKSQDWWKRRKHPHQRKINKTGCNIAKYEENVEDLRTSEVPLSRPTSSFTDIIESVNIKEEGESKPKIKRQRKRTQKNKDKWNKYKKYLKSLPTCDLSIKKSLSDSEWGEKEKEGKSKRNNKRCRKQTKMRKEKWNEQKKYLESLPLCPLSKNEALSDIEWGDNKSGIVCLSIKKELD